MVETLKIAQNENYVIMLVREKISAKVKIHTWKKRQGYQIMDLQQMEDSINSMTICHCRIDGEIDMFSMTICHCRIMFIKFCIDNDDKLS